MAAARSAERCILVVEDDAAIRDALSLVLEDEGYRVTGAANGQEALAHLRNGCRPNLIILDLMMPVMDGWQFRKHQLQDSSLAAIPVVVLSADGNVLQKAADIDAVDCLQKPIDLDCLLEKVGRYAK